MEIPYTSQSREDTGLYNAKLGIWLFLASEVMLFGALFSTYIMLRVGALPGYWPHGLLNIPIGTFNTAVLITSSVTVVLSWNALKLGDFAKYRKLQAITLLCALGFLGIKSYEYREKFGHYEVWLKAPITVKHGDKEVQTDRLLGHIEHNGAHPFFWKTQTLAEKKVEAFKFEPDPFHYMMSAKEIAHARKESAGHEHKAIEIKSADVVRLSAFVPGHSTYFAVYFTLTALHALHVFGGALVIFYIWGPGAKMWQTDRERYINRVEVSGLFWHFVDLVWIFLFPVLYLL
ncbi:MAG: cytochrome c oxidase subunit 3 [Verrucomicrobia bacterium]|nr:cytochrome c oxidase subunit 3 [Verrucomicrobiota bacterium]